MIISQFKLKLKLLYTIFISSPKKWQLPKKYELLIYDATNIETLIPNLKKYSFHIMYIRGESINIICMFHAFFTLTFWKGKPLDAYIYAYIKVVNPKVVVTLIDNDKKFYSISQRFPKVKTIFLQNGIRTFSGDIFSNLIKSDNYHVDYMMVAGKAIGKHYLKYLSGNYVAIGNIKNNNVKKSFYEKKDYVLFISQLHKKPKAENHFYKAGNGMLISWKVFYEIEITVLKFLSKWCDKNNKLLKICGRTNDNFEKHFYKYYLQKYKCRWIYIPRQNSYATYAMTDEANIVVSIDSTLGYESLARGNKTAFFSCRGFNLKDTSYNFGWPSELPSNGLMWCSNQEELEFQLPRIMNYLHTVDNVSWKKVCHLYSRELMEFDSGNVYFIKLLDQLLSKKENKNYVN